MKALIVIEIPDDHMFKAANDLFDRLHGYKCELKPVPIEFGIDIEDDYAKGWNACIKEIMK